MSQFGFVYILTSQHMPGLYKIGLTERSPHRRASELSKATGVPDDFEVAYYVEVEQCQIIERSAHDSLAQFRVLSNREFFRAPLIEVIGAIEAAARESCGILSSWDGHAAVMARVQGYAHKDYAAKQGGGL